MISIINDLHIDVRRRGGTTPASARALWNYTISQFKKLLKKCEKSSTLIILGDLFDKAKVSEAALYQTLAALREYLQKSGADLIIVRGNHDNRSDVDNSICSLESLYMLLLDFKDAGAFTGEVHLVFNEPADFYLPVAGGDVTHLHIIPHLFNQSAFDEALGAVPEETGYLLLHANFDSPFATGDHSLNISKAAAKQITERGIKILVAHEHQARAPMKGVTVLGNQFPTSIADCLGNKEKRLWHISDRLEGEISWQSNLNFIDVGVNGLMDTVPTPFMRVSGECQRHEFAAAVRAVSEYRKKMKSGVFIVSNNIKIAETRKAVSKEDIEGLDIISMLLEELTESQKRKVQACLND